MLTGRWKKLAIAGAILTIGIGTALVFRRDQPAETKVSERLPDALRQAGDDPAAKHKSQPQPALSGRIEPYSPNEQMNPVAHASPRSASPALDVAGQPEKQTDSPISWQTVRRPNDRDLMGKIEPEQTAFDSVPEPRTNTYLPTAESTHQVRDGDTLAALARRYLGSEERSLDLFEYNRDVLVTPDLLPIGKELRIPSRNFVPAPAPLGEPQSRDLTAAATAPVTAQKPIAASKAPVSAPPAPGGQRASQTYVVQQHDTLALIARKLYGDISRQEDLMAANRQQLRSANDLRPGMTLFVPSAPSDRR